MFQSNNIINRTFIKLGINNESLSLQIKYKEEWEKTKSKACDIGVDDMSVRAAKASRDLASDVRENTMSQTELYSI